MLAPDELTVEAARQLIATASQGPESLGAAPETSQPVYLKTGRYGPYVQLGDASDDGKPKMASLLPNMDPKDVGLELALKLLSLPRIIGPHPDDQEPVIAANGRFGPYVKVGKEIRSIPSGQFSPLDITLEQAVELLKQPKGKRQAAQPKTLKELGKHPISERTLTILSGRYGPYVTDGEINASLQRGMSPETLSIDDAVNLLEARAARISEGGGRPARRGFKKAAKKTKKAAKKKAPSE
jgi:DNA topoisomerase-1